MILIKNKKVKKKIKKTTIFLCSSGRVLWKKIDKGVCSMCRMFVQLPENDYVDYSTPAFSLI